MPSTKRIAPTVSLTSSFFHRDSDANQTIIWLRSKQRHALNKFYNFTYFFQILGSNMRFQKIPKNTHTVNLYSEFSILNLYCNHVVSLETGLFVSEIDRPCFMAIEIKDINNI